MESPTKNKVVNAGSGTVVAVTNDPKLPRYTSPAVSISFRETWVVAVPVSGMTQLVAENSPISVDEPIVVSDWLYRSTKSLVPLLTPETPRALAVPGL